MDGSQPLPFNFSTIFLKVFGEALTVIQLDGTEALSMPFHFKIDALIDRYFDMSGSIKSPAQITFTGIDGYKRIISGIITKVEEGEPHQDGQLKCQFILESNLRLLALRTDNRIILGHTLPDIVRDTCERHGITQIHFDLSQSYPVQPYVVQVGETDLDFIQRLLGKSGITFWSSCNSDKQNQEQITFTDHNANCPYIPRGVLEFKAPDNLIKEYNNREVHVGIHKMQVETKQQTDSYAIHDWNENTPATNLYTTAGVGTHNPTQGFAPSLSTRFGLGTKALDETQRLAKQHADYAKSQSWSLEAHGNVIDMAAGHVFSLDASDFNPEHNGDMIITAVTHHASQAAGLNLDGNEIAYRHEAICIKRDTPYRPYIPNHPEVPMTFIARIESEGKYSNLDAQGRYKLRNLFDLSVTDHTQASTPIRKLQPFGGPPNESTVGMHMPLQDGDEVLLSCLNGDPDRPMIVGSTYTADKVSPVTARNKTENTIKTKADNALIMDDKIDKEAITLRTYGGYTILQLNADRAGHTVLLETKRGAINQFAKKTHTTQTKEDSIFERSGNDRLEIVENTHTTDTKEGSIHHQAKTDIIEKAHKNIKTNSGQNTEIRAGNNLIYNVQDNATFTIKGKDGFFAKVHNGELTINAAKEISLTGNGGGDITVEQNGGGFKIDPGGNVFLYGKNVKLGGQGQVNLIGNVNYTIGGGSIPGAASVTAPLARQEIEPIEDPNAAKIENLAWRKDLVKVGKIAHAEFLVSGFEGGETATITVYEWDVDGKQQRVDTLTTTLDDGAGHYSVSWERTSEEINEDLEDDKENPVLWPLTYRFEVEVDGEQAKEISDALWYYKDVVGSIKNKDSTPIENGTEVILYTPDDQLLYQYTVDGTVTFTDVVVGIFKMDVPGIE